MLFTVTTSHKQFHTVGEGCGCVLQDEEIRQGVKQYSEWPTYPQLYANSELVGGCDIILEMSGTGDLLGVVQSSMAGS